jgi:hypothetical protein
MTTALGSAARCLTGTGSPQHHSDGVSASSAAARSRRSGRRNIRRETWRGKPIWRRGQSGVPAATMPLLGPCPPERPTVAPDNRRIVAPPHRCRSVSAAMRPTMSFGVDVRSGTSPYPQGGAGLAWRVCCSWGSDHVASVLEAGLVPKFANPFAQSSALQHTSSSIPSGSRKNSDHSLPSRWISPTSWAPATLSCS